MTAPTPGPWEWVEAPSRHSLDYPADTPDKAWNGRDEFPGSFDELRGGDGEGVLFGFACNDDTAGVGVDEADARLIAAAPDLLEALKAIRAAIQRAHAETESGGDGGPLAQVSVSFLDGAVNAIRKAEGHE